MCYQYTVEYYIYGNCTTRDVFSGSVTIILFFLFFSFFFRHRSLIYYNAFFFLHSPLTDGLVTIVGSSITSTRFFLDTPLFFSLLFFTPHWLSRFSYIKLSIFPEGGRGRGRGDGSGDQRQCEEMFASKFGNIQKLDGSALLIIIWSIVKSFQRKIRLRHY